ncbi:MAG TPA: serine/threonine-protein kinase [Polyangiaceae bacterium]
MLEPGTLFAIRYEILCHLGGGGSGLVYKALDRTTDNFVAIKVLRPHLLLDRDAHEKLVLEARNPGRVQSEHLVRVFDAGRDPSTQVSFLVMEYLDGRTLEQVVAEEGALDCFRVAEYLRQVGFGLDKVHTRRDSDGRPAPTLHRDLKPSNLMLTHRDDETPLVKILDWGIAKVLSDSATVSLDIKGTPLYMAPEQLSQAPLTPATDVYAIGLVAFFLLTGHSYWKAGQGADLVQAAILKEVCEGPVVPPRKRIRQLRLNVDLPPAFDAWFLKCLNLDQAKRYQSAGVAARELASALNVSLRVSYPPASSKHSQAHLTSVPRDQTQPAAMPFVASPSSAEKRWATPPPSPRRRARVYASVVGVMLGVGVALAVAIRMRGERALPSMAPSLPSQEVLMALPASAAIHAAMAPPATTATARQPIASAKRIVTAPPREPQKKPNIVAESVEEGSDDLLSNDGLRRRAERALVERAKAEARDKTE